jgi:hypothetical protein
MVNNSKFNKIVYFAFGLIMAFFVIFSLYFMTRYAYIIVFYTIENGKHEYYSGSSAGGGSYTNQTLFRLFNIVFVKNSEEQYAAKEGWGIDRVFADRDEFLNFIVDFRTELNSFNTSLLWFGITGLIMFAVMLIVGNHNRNVYYISNLIAGVICSLTMIIFGLILLIKDIQLISRFNDDAKLWQAVSIAQQKGNDSASAIYYDTYINTNNPDKYFAGEDSVNTTTLITTMIFMIVSIGYSIFTLIHTIRKYFATKAHRKEILERAGVIA